MNMKKRIGLLGLALASGILHKETLSAEGAKLDTAKIEQITGLKGAWNDADTPIPNTCFALLFLSRASEALR